MIILYGYRGHGTGATVVLEGNQEKYKQKPILGLACIGRYKQSLYFSLVPTWYDCRSLALFRYDNQI